MLFDDPDRVQVAALLDDPDVSRDVDLGWAPALAGARHFSRWIQPKSLSVAEVRIRTFLGQMRTQAPQQLAGALPATMNSAA